MASYRPFPPPTQSTFAQAPLTNQNSLPPQPPPGQGRGGSQYSQNWGYNGGPGGNYQQQQYNPTGSRNQAPPPPQFAPPPPPPDGSYPPPPPPSVPSQSGPPPSIYYPTSQQYSQYNQNQPMQPPPPPSPPPSSSLPPPPPPPASPPRPPSSAPPVQSKDGSRHNQLNSSRHRKPPVASVPEKKTHGHPGRGVETEEERRLRKKREYEKQRHEEKHRHQVKESQNKILQKTQMLSSGIKGHGSITGSHIGERRTNPLLTGERAENRLKKPTTFLCKLK